MKREPTTFTLLLGLMATILVLTVAIASFVALRIRLSAISNTFSPLLASTAIAAETLDTQADMKSAASLQRLQQLGVQIVNGSPPPSQPHPLLTVFARRVGILLGDPTRVVAVQSPDLQVWVRSSAHPSRWIVMHAASYRQQMINSLLFTMLLTGLIALIITTLATRLLTRPLERLAQHAGELLRGEPCGDLLHGSLREVRSLATAIDEAGQRIRNAARERELMLAGVSHDLRTPLARLRIALELGDAGDPSQRVAMIDDLEQLDGTIEQCLAFVRDGRDERFRETDMTTLVAQLIGQRMQPEDWHLDASVPARIAVRPTQLRRALNNLMDNAERYGMPPFEIELTQDTAQITITIGDHGPGVDDELLSKLGQPFLRGDRARGGSGSGLGLSIVMRIARFHGGRLHLRRRAGGGFEAQLILPYAKVSQEASLDLFY